jgi:hypothetical protein
MPLKLVLASVAIAGFGLVATAAASALQFEIEATNGYGPLTDVGATTINIFVDRSVESAHFRCGSAGALVLGQVVLMSATVDSGEPDLTLDCEQVGSANVGSLDPGDYQVNATIVLPDRSMTNVTSTFSIVARGNKCNVDPTLTRIYVTLVNKTVNEFRDALANDGAYRARLGDIAFIGESPYSPGFVFVRFPPLDDPARVVDRLQRSGEFNLVSVEGRVCFATPPPDAIGTAIEYHNTVLDHYFFTPDTKEQQAIDAGMVGLGWVRTGQSFRVVTTPGCPVAEEGVRHPVYRFAGEANIGPNSHFFTLNQDECGVVRDRADWHWMFEGAPFWASEPVAGACPAGYRRGSQPLYRAYNNGMGGDPNHRYATDHAIIDAMVAQGWIDEGIAMCVQPSP